MKSEYFLAGLFIVLLLICLNPFDVFMPSAMVMMLLVGIIVVFGVFSAVLWKERPRDEREAVLSQKAGRVAFLIGTGVLVIGIVLEEYMHHEDPWLIYALIAMVLGKIISHIYFQNK